MTKVPLKWKKLTENNEEYGKVEINAVDSADISSTSPALKVNGEIVSTGDIVSDNISMASMASDVTDLSGRVTTIENSIPTDGIIRATASMALASGVPSGVEAGKGKFYSNGIALPNGGSPINAIWVKANGVNVSGVDAEIGMGSGSGVLYLRQYDSNNTVSKEATLFDANGNAAFPGTIVATTFSGALNGTASNATTVSNMAVASGRNNVANQIMRTDSSGNAQFGVIDTLATDLSAAAMSKVYCSDGNEIKYKSVSNFVDALNLADNFLGYKVRIATSTQTVAIDQAWGDLFEGYATINFSNLGLQSIQHAWVSAWSAEATNWEIYPSIFSIDTTSATIYFVRGESNSGINIKINLLIFGT